MMHSRSRLLAASLLIPCFTRSFSGPAVVVSVGSRFHYSSTTRLHSMASSSSSSDTRPTLRGVVFDMDGTLTVPNLNFAKLYKDCGLEGKKDILAEIANMPLEEQAKMLQIVEDFEQDGRNRMELMPGAVEVLAWLRAHNIPVALVTRNTQRTVDVFVERLQQRLHLPLSTGDETSTTTAVLFDHVIARDDARNIPPKPDPTALHIIAKDMLQMDAPTCLVHYDYVPIFFSFFFRFYTTITNSRQSRF